MGKKKSPAFDKIKNKQSRLGTFLKKRNGLVKKAKEFSTIDGPSIAVAGSSTITAESPSIDSMLDEYLYNVVGFPSIDTRVDDFISDATGYPSIDSTVDECLATTTVGSFQNTLKAMSEFDLEAWDDLEELLALRRVSWNKSSGRGRG